MTCVAGRTEPNKNFFNLRICLLPIRCLFSVWNCTTLLHHCYRNAIRKSLEPFSETPATAHLLDHGKILRVEASSGGSDYICIWNPLRPSVEIGTSGISCPLWQPYAICTSPALLPVPFNRRSNMNHGRPALCLYRRLFSRFFRLCGLRLMIDASIIQNAALPALWPSYRIFS